MVHLALHAHPRIPTFHNRIFLEKLSLDGSHPTSSRSLLPPLHCLLQIPTLGALVARH